MYGVERTLQYGAMFLSFAPAAFMPTDKQRQKRAWRRARFQHRQQVARLRCDALMGYGAASEIRLKRIPGNVISASLCPDTRFSLFRRACGSNESLYTVACPCWKRVAPGAQRGGRKREHCKEHHERMLVQCQSRARRTANEYQRQNPEHLGPHAPIEASVATPSPYTTAETNQHQ